MFSLRQIDCFDMRGLHEGQLCLRVPLRRIQCIWYNLALRPYLVFSDFPHSPRKHTSRKEHFLSGRAPVSLSEMSVGTPCYLPSLLLRQRPWSGEVVRESDWWFVWERSLNSGGHHSSSLFLFLAVLHWHPLHRTRGKCAFGNLVVHSSSSFVGNVEELYDNGLAHTTAPLSLPPSPLSPCFS